MRKPLQRKISIVLAASLLAVLIFERAEAGSISARFLAMGDIYDVSAEERPVGGAGRLMTALRYERKRSGDAAVFTFHAGDALSPSYLSAVDRGSTMLGILNSMGIDAFVPGNHEFDIPFGLLQERIKESAFPWVAANILYDGKPLKEIKKWVLLEKNGVKVAVAGITTNRISSTDNSMKKLSVTDPVAALAETLPQIEKAGADFIVLLSHEDVEADYELLKRFPSVQLVLGGHNHTPMLREYMGRLLAKPGSEGKWLLIVDTRISDDRRFLWDAHFLTVDEKYVFDPEAKKYLLSREKLLSAGFDEKVATSSVPLDALDTSVRTRESNVGDMVTDAVRDFFGDSKIDVAFLNGGALRWDSLRPPGPLAIKDIYSLLPFDNKAVVLKLGGKAVFEALEHSVSHAGSDWGGFLQISGLKFSYDTTRPPGSRICDAYVLRNSSWQPLLKDETYTVSVPDYLFNGGDGYTMFSSAKVVLPPESGPSMDQLLIQWLRAKKEIAPKEEGRIENRRCK